MKIFPACLLFVFVLIGTFSAKARQLQRLPDSIQNKFDFYRARMNNGILYAHFDKTIYTNNENIWFTAYLLNGESALRGDVLSAILVSDDDNKILLQEKFAMAGRVAFGNLFLPDSIPSGNYSIMIYTNLVKKGKLVDLFTQSITVKNTTEASFSASLSLDDEAKHAAENKSTILLVTNSKGSRIISGATVNYYIGDKKHPVISGTTKTDKYGQYLFTVPTAGLTPLNNIFKVQITSGKEVKNVQIALPVIEHEPPIIKFYPEGGDLSAGLINSIGWEAKNSNGNPQKITGVLYKDKEVIDTISTNSFGMGCFSLYPDATSKYYLKLLGAGLNEAIYNLPQIVPDNPVITVKTALANDTLSVVVQTAKSGNYSLLVHNYKDVFFSVPVNLSKIGKVVKLVLDGLPRGLAEVTLLDSLHRPRAERLFFAHYDSHNSVQIITNQNDFKTRQKVELTLGLENSKGKPISGLVSVACVQANRLELTKANDIESYFYLNNDLGRLPVKEKLMGYNAEDKAYLEDILLIKGWRRYTWTDLLYSKTADTLDKTSAGKITGTITLNGRPLKKRIDLMMMRDSALFSLTTDANGKFAFSNQQLLIPENKKFHLFLAGRSILDYSVKINDPNEKLGQGLAQIYQPPSFIQQAGNQQNEDEKALAGLQHVIYLNEVKIKSTINDLSYAATENACGDYVCLYHILNCPNHHGSVDNTLPIKGERYLQFNRALDKYEHVFYEGCDQTKLENSMTINGIQYAVEFYPSDYAQVNPSGPEYVSTIYWQYLYKISDINTKPIHFYTSDITGPFKIIVQGLTTEGVVSGEKTIMVEKP